MTPLTDAMKRNATHQRLQCLKGDASKKHQSAAIELRNHKVRRKLLKNETQISHLNSQTQMKLKLTPLCSKNREELLLKIMIRLQSLHLFVNFAVLISHIKKIIFCNIAKVSNQILIMLHLEKVKRLFLDATISELQLTQKTKQTLLRKLALFSFFYYFSFRLGVR